MSARASCSSHPRLLTSCAALAVLGGVLAAPGDARASGYLTARYGADHGSPAQANTFAVYYNPAALGGTKGTTITGDVSAMLRFARYNRTGDALSPSSPSLLEDPAYVRSNTGTANLTNLLALPFAGVNTDFGTENLRAGYAVYVPFGGQATWSPGAAVPGEPGAADGVQRWHNVSGKILAVYNTFALAYRLHPRVSIGASVSPVVHSVSTVRARNADGSDDTVVGGNLVEGRSLMEVSGFNIAASAGVYFEPARGLHLGLAYLSQPGFGETRMSGTLETKLGTNPVTKQDVDLLQTYPDIVRLGANWQITPRLVLRGDLSYARWSVFEYQCVVNPGEKCAVAKDGRDLSGGRVILNIPRRWNDAIGGRIGPGYWLNDRTEAFGSLGFSTSAVPKETIDASTLDATRLYLTFGAKYSFNEHFALAGSYNHIYFFDVNTNGRSETNIPAHPPSSPEGGDYTASRSPSANGRYRSQIGGLNVNVAYTF